MKSEPRAPVIQLLTDPEAARVLGLAVDDLDHLVEAGALRPVHVLPRGGRRFWPADVEAAGGAATLIPAASDAPATVSVDPPDAPRPRRSGAEDGLPGATDRAAAPVPPHRARAKAVATEPRRPRWPWFEVAPPRATTTYLAFRDADHVASYLRARSRLEPAADRSADLAPAPARLVTA